MQTDYLIVGAGVSGLTAALTIKSVQADANITLLDAASEPGGLLRSVGFDEHPSLHFDLGTHIPELTSNQALNALVFPEEVIKHWQRLSELKVGNFFNDQLNQQSQFLNVSKDESIFCQALVELLQTQPSEMADFLNLEDFLIARYGQALTQQVFKPLIFKMTAVELKELVPQTINFYGLARIALGNQQIGLNLKQIPHLDQALAFNQDSERPRQSTWVYPGEQGVGEWVKTLYQQCLDKNVKFEFNQRVEQVVKAASGYQLKLQSGRQVDTKHLVWTLPFYVGLSGGQQTRFVSRSIAIYHFTSQYAPNTACHYIYCQQAAFHSYRLTFYDNVAPKNATQPYRTTVEVIYDGEKPEPKIIQQELVEMGLFSSPESIQLAGITTVPYGFPVPVVAQQQIQHSLFKEVAIQNPDVVFTGRGKPGLFFTTDVLLDVYQQTSKLASVKGG
jgi:protoporphyrinogen oxidase